MGSRRTSVHQFVNIFQGRLGQGVSETDRWVQEEHQYISLSICSRVDMAKECQRLIDGFKKNISTSFCQYIPG